MKQFLMLIFAIQTFAMPAQILIIRHGEKPSSKEGLSDLGKERSGALAFFFTLNPFVLDFGLPAAIYAFKTHSVSRGVETVTPLSMTLDVPIQALHYSSNTDHLVQDILNDPTLEGKMVLICWEHNNMRNLVKKLGGPDVPAYPNDRFDLIYKLTFHKGGSPTFCVGLENLMQPDLKTLPPNFIRFACDRLRI